MLDLLPQRPHTQRDCPDSSLRWYGGARSCGQRTSGVGAMHIRACRVAGGWTCFVASRHRLVCISSGAHVCAKCSRLLFGNRTTGSPFLPRRPIEIRGLSIVRGDHLAVITYLTLLSLRRAQPPGMASLQMAASAHPVVHCRAGAWQKTPAQRTPGAGLRLRLPLSPPQLAQTWTARPSQRRQAVKAQAAVKTGAAPAPDFARGVISDRVILRSGKCSAVLEQRPGTLAAAIGMPIPCPSLWSPFRNVEQRFCAILRAPPASYPAHADSASPLILDHIPSVCSTLRDEA